MKFCIILLILFLHNEYGNATGFVDLVNSKMTEFAMAFSNSFTALKTKVKKYFLSQIVGPDMDPVITNVYYNIDGAKSNTFNDFVEKVASESETEIPEYANYKSEPTALMSTPQLATSHGRRVESHVLQTKDGYLLTLHRVLPLGNTNVTTNNETVFLHHGLLGSSADWILLGSEESLPYILSNAGYDVWLANARGNYYSRGHTSMRVDSVEFWKFTWHDIGQYDLLAAVDYIRQIKNMTSESMNYIGHSMGATALLVLLSSQPQYNKYFRIGILLAPLAYMTNTKGPLRVLTHMSYNPPESLLRSMGKGEFLPSRKVPKWLVTKYCSGHLLFCSNPLLFITGGSVEETWNSSFIARILYHVPAGGSTNTILHYAQLVKSGKFHQYNNQASEYPLNKVTLPIALFSSNADQLATVSDVLRLYFSIGNPIDHYIIQKANFGHTDFVWGSEAKLLVFTKVLDYLENGLGWNLFKLNEIL